MKSQTTVAVIGGGPAGSYAALTAARKGLDVLLLEEHQEVGVPSHCSGHVNVSSFEKLGIKLPENLIENKICGARIFSPRGRLLLVRRDQPVTYVLNRAGFDKYLWSLAEEAGADCQTGVKADRLIMNGGAVKGTVVKTGHARCEIHSRLVIDAEGSGAALARTAGLMTSKASSFVNSAQVDVDRVDEVDPDLVEVYLTHHYAPGFFAWIIPRRDLSGKVGLAVKGRNAETCLKSFMRHHPVASKKLRKSKIRRMSLHPIPVGGAIRKTYAPGLMVVGDAASQVKPTTGGGIVFGIICGRIAGRIAHEAWLRKDFSEKTLSKYQSEFEVVVGKDLQLMKGLRQMLDRLPDSQLDRIVAAASRVGVDQILEDVGDVDFQGWSIAQMLRRPASLGILLYTFLSSLLRPDRPIIRRSAAQRP